MGRIAAATTIEELAGLVSTTLEAVGIRAVLSGGAVVSIYTNNEYESSDLDFISSAAQCVMDRLAAYFHWNDLQSLDQAVMVASSQKISLAKVEAWAKREGAVEKLGKFKQQLAARKGPR